MIAPRVDVDALAPVPHGGPGGAVDDAAAPVVLDFSANINAWGPAPHVVAAIRHADPAGYPDPEALAPRQAAAHLWGVPLDRTRFAPGAADLIHRIARAYLQPGDCALIAAPAFGEYARAARAAGALVVELRAAHHDADPAADELARQIRELRPRLAFVASPTSPLGAPRADEQLLCLAETIAPYGLLVVDEAYRSFALGRFAPPALLARDDVVHLRSITKDCALAGVRAAFAVAAPAVLRALDAADVPWSASAPAQAAAAAALTAEGAAHVERTLQLMTRARNELAAGLAALGLQVLPSAANFLCVRVGTAPRRETDVRAAHGGRLAAALGERGIRVRDCASFGLPDHIRVAVRTPPANQRLLACLEEVLC